MLSQGNHTIQRVFDFYLHSVDVHVILQCESKKSPAVFWHFFQNLWEFLTKFWHAYYTFRCTLDYKFLLNYFQLWRSYAVLSDYNWHKKSGASSSLWRQNMEMAVYGRRYIYV